CALAAIPTGERMQTWRWTGSDWTLLGPSPGWVTTASMVADPWDDSVVMVADGGDGRAATFVWNGAAWRGATGGAEPPVTPGVRPRRGDRGRPGLGRAGSLRRQRRRRADLALDGLSVAAMVHHRALAGTAAGRVDGLRPGFAQCDPGGRAAL